MSIQTDKPTPKTIVLETEAQILDIGFSNGTNFNYPSEYLRVNSPSTQVKSTYKPVHGKQDVKIEHIEPQGSYAIRIYYNDGHSTGIYSWDLLYSLGSNYENNWKEYLQKLEKYGLSREDETAQHNVDNTLISLHYYPDLQKITGIESEVVSIPVAMITAQELVKWLLQREPEWTDALTDDRIQITVNNNFIEPGTQIVSGNDVAFIAGNSS